MASVQFNEGLRLILSDSVSLSSNTIKIMLLNSSVTPTGDEITVAPFSAAEISVTNYTPGFGGSGRKTLTSGNMAFTKDDAANKVFWDYTADFTWTSLGSGATIHAALIYKHTGAADSDCIPLAYIQLATARATGGDFTFQMPTAGIYEIQLL